MARTVSCGLDDSPGARAAARAAASLGARLDLSVLLAHVVSSQIIISSTAPFCEPVLFRSVSLKATRHPAHIPQEVAASSRPPPRIPATPIFESPRSRTQIAANPRPSRKRHDRPVTPEVAGSSPVAPVNFLQNASFWPTEAG